MTKDRHTDGGSERWEDALHVNWDAGSDQEIDQLASRVRRPKPQPKESLSAHAALPEDVRASLAANAVGAMKTLHVGPIDVTVLLEPPAEARADGLWTLTGRAWRRDGAQEPFLLYLVQDDHVLAETELKHGGRFEFQDLLEGEPALEFHLGDGSTAVVAVPLP